MLDGCAHHARNGRSTRLAQMHKQHVRDVHNIIEMRICDTRSIYCHPILGTSVGMDIFIRNVDIIVLLSVSDTCHAAALMHCRYQAEDATDDSNTEAYHATFGFIHLETWNLIASNKQSSKQREERGRTRERRMRCHTVRTVRT